MLLQRVFVGNSDLYDFGLDPRDSFYPFVGHGSCANIYVCGNKPESKNWDVVLFRFVASGTPGDTLNWHLDGLSTFDGLSTRILDGQSKTVDITDNYVVIVPEPGVVGGGGGFMAFDAAWAAHRRRR